MELMIAQLEGKIAHKELGFIVLDVGGVGYKVYLPLSSAGDVGEVGTSVRVWTHLHVREDALDLYGFVDKEALDIFLMLIKVSGIGPKSALNILSVVSIASLRQAISESDHSYLTKIGGIGRKTAEKIVLELRDKLPALPASGDPASSLHVQSDALEALESLGYGRREASDALRNIKEGSASERVREALKLLGKSA